ncbi:MAG: hypothetical protein M1416_01040 [Candidatus Pacearchaeota archaeon]|nr:hypothetical protein [Candidatus Pacearchaeota archaeon]
MKKSLLIVFILVMAVGFVSAQDLLSDLLNSLDESMVVLSAIFIISFSILYFSLSKLLFKKDVTISAVISVILAFLITYGVNKSGFDFSGFFFDLGISENVFMTIIPLAILGGVVFTIIKLGSKSLLVFGGLLVALSFFVYAKALLIVVGIILLIIGAILATRKNKKNPLYQGRD